MLTLTPPLPHTLPHRLGPQIRGSERQPAYAANGVVYKQAMEDPHDMADMAGRRGGKPVDARYLRIVT